MGVPCDPRRRAYPLNAQSLSTLPAIATTFFQKLDGRSWNYGEKRIDSPESARDMRVRRRKFKEHSYQHIYQNTVGGVLLFYHDIDRLVYYTAFAVTARKYQAQVLAFSLMYDHTHSSVRLKDPFRLGDFVRDYTSIYAMEFNRDIGRHGPLFQCAYGNAPKVGAKALRTNVAYIDNNAVEKQLCERAEEYRWNLLAYLNSSHPFSKELKRSRSSRRLLRSLKRVEAFSRNDAYLPYPILRSLYDGLTQEETEQLTDFIIHTYLPIDRQERMSLYGSYENMLTAINSNTGSEYDIKEEYETFPHTIFRELLHACRHAPNPKALTVLTPAEKKRIASRLQQKTGASYYQLKKFLAL